MELRAREGPPAGLLRLAPGCKVQREARWEGQEGQEGQEPGEPGEPGARSQEGKVPLGAFPLLSQPNMEISMAALQGQGPPLGV